MTAWPTVLLGEIATIDRNTVLPSEIDSGTTYIGLENILSGGELAHVGAVEAGHLASAKFRFSPEHILYGKLRPYLAKIAISEYSGVCSTDILPIRPSKGLDKQYLLQVLRQPSMIDLANARSSGANLPRLSPTELLKFTIPFPPLAEQRRIAAILDHVDALRAKRREAFAQLEELTQATFVDMFGDPVSNDRGWESGTIGSCIDGFDSGRNLIGNDDDNGGYRVLKVSAVTSLTFKNAESKPLPSGYVPPAAHLVEVGDLLFSRANTAELVGATAFVSHTDGRTALPDKLWRFRWKAVSLAAPRYVEKLFQRPQFRQLISDRATGSSGSMKNISRDKVLSINLGWPPFDMQKEFSERIEQIDLIADKHRAALAELDSLFVSLQSRAFRGEL